MDITTVRLLAVNLRPYYSKALYRLEFNEVEDIDTITADSSFRLYYDPKVLNKWSVQESAGKMIQLCEHLVRQHAQRKNNIDAKDLKAWGRAAELEVNNRVEEGDLSMPKGYISPKNAGEEPDKIAEQYYKEDPNKDESGDSKGDNCIGSCAGCPNSYEKPSADSGGNGVTSVEAELISEQVARDIKEHAASHGIGSVPAGLMLWANNKLQPKVDYRKLLRAVISKQISNKRGQTDYSYRNMSRREDPVFVFPSMTSPEVRIGVVVDSSGSMGTSYDGKTSILDQAISEVVAVIQQCNVPEIEFATCDMKVHGARIRSKSEIKIKGGGGTDMSEGIAYMDELPKNRRPEILITVTDGWTPWPERCPRGMQHIAVLLGDHPQEPPFGRILHRPSDGKWMDVKK